MAKKFLTSIDLNGNQLIHPILENLTSNPATTVAGRLAYNTSTDKPIVRGNSGWTSLMTEVKYPNLVSIENIATAKGYLKKNSAGSWSIVNETYSPSGHSHAWSEITSKPSTFAPSTHNHDTLYRPIDYVPAWADITNKPTTFAPSTHSHSWAQITSKPITLSGFGITDATAISTFNALNDLFNSMFEIDGTMIKVKKPLYSVGEITAFGKAAGSGATGGGGTATTELRLLEDVTLTTLAPNNILIYNGSKWVNSTMAAISPDMQGYASEQYVQGEIANLIGGAPAHLDTLIEISELLGADSNYSGTIVQAIGERVVKNSKAPATTNTGGILKIKHDSKGLVTASQAVAAADFTTALLGSGTANATTYLTGAKTWVTFENSVRATKLTGLTVSTNSTILAADTLIAALGKLQAQIDSKTTSTGTVTSVKAGTGLSGGTITTTGTISHATGNGWNHIPSNGVNGQLLQFSATGAAKWATWKKTGVFSTSSTTYTIAHGLGNADVIAQVYSSTGEAVECDINVDTTNVVFKFNVAPAINAYKYVIIG